MKFETVRKFILPPGPILSLTLIGLLLLSAVIYYRAVKIQRFLEPALAFSQPRLQFSQSINNLLSKEFGGEETKGVRFRAGAILVNQAVLFPPGEIMKPDQSRVLHKLGHVFLAALNEPDIRDNISLILVSTRLPLSPDAQMNRALRFQLQSRALLILNSLYATEPALEKKYGEYFAATSLPLAGPLKEAEWIEFRIVPAERFHIILLQRLEKYVR
jgi:hypothetical protein